jgi:glc operon protein GlcG
MSKPRDSDKRAHVPVRVMTQDIAAAVVKAAQAKAAELGITMSVAVVDESGNLVYFVRGDTSSFITFETARGKAVAAAGFRRPTQDYEEHFRSHPAFWSSIADNLKLVPGPGGYPLTRDGVMIGGVGCGGGLGGEDELCAQAGALAIGQ